MSKRGNKDFGINKQDPLPEETSEETVEQTSSEEQTTADPEDTVEAKDESTVVVEEPKVVETLAPVEVAPVITETKQTVTPQMSKLENELTIYQEKMLGKLDQAEVGKIQYGLYNVLRGVLNTENQEEARVNWNTILKFANANKDKAFNEHHLFRGAESWPGSAVEHTNFRRVCWLVVQTADVKTRSAVARTEVNFALVTEGMRPNEATNLINFYS